MPNESVEPIRVRCSGFEIEPTVADIVAFVCTYVQSFQFQHKEGVYTLILETGWALSPEKVAAIEAELRKDTCSLKTRMGAELVSTVVDIRPHITAVSELRMDLRV